MSACDLPNDEALAIMAVPKFGEPLQDWVQDRTHPGSAYNAFGVLDVDGAALRGLQVEFSVFRSTRTVQEKYTFSLRRVDMGVMYRVYQQEINTSTRLRPADHQWSHEHIGDLRKPADLDWSRLTFREAVARFCEQCNLTLTDSLPDFDAIVLR